MKILNYVIWLRVGLITPDIKVGIYVFLILVSTVLYPVSWIRIALLTFRHRASCILGQAFHYSPENAFYIFNQQIYFII